MGDIENFCESENYRFYLKHKKELGGIIQFAENMENEIFARQQSQLSILNDFLDYAKKKTTENDRIQCWTDGDHPCIMHYYTGSKLGIEFAFGISESNLCGKIRFIITEWRDWGKNAWEKHKGKIMEAYPGREFRQSPHKNQYFIDYDITITDGVIENRDELVEKIIEMDALLK